MSRVGATMRRLGWVVGLLALLGLAAKAEDARTYLRVTAQVLPRVRLDPVSVPSTLTVSPADLERGYAEVESRFRIDSNDPKGYLLDFAPRVGLAERVVVLGLGLPVEVGELGAQVFQPRAAPHQEYALRIRVTLPPGLPPGEYPLPVAFGATTL